MKYGLIKLMIFLPLFFPAIPGAGSTGGYEVIRDLRPDWEFYSEKDHGYLPYIAGNETVTKTIYFHLPLRKYRNKYLIISFQPAASLWINERLAGHYPERETVWFSIDSLIQNHAKDTILVSVYDPASTFDELVTVIGVKAPVTVEAKSVNEIFKRNVSKEKNSFIVIAFLIIAFFTFWYNIFPGEFRFFFSLGSLFTPHGGAGSLTGSLVITKPKLIFIIGLSFVISYLLVVHQYVDEIPVLSGLLTGHSVFGGWFLLSMVIFIVFILKYLLILILGSLFGIRDLSNFYFLGIMVLSMIFYAFLFIIIIVSGLSVYHKTGSVIQFFTYLVVFFYPLRMVFMFFALRRNTTINNLHLFSYLCATELIPVIFGLKYLFQ